jgi:hypothetical protein
MTQDPSRRAARKRRQAALPLGPPHPTLQFRCVVFGDPRGPWRESRAEAERDAIDQGIASWDDERGEWFLAVPVDVENRSRDAVPQS